MKIKVIDLFNDIANNKTVPSKIKISKYIYHFDIDESTYTRFINNDLENPRGLLEDIDLHNAYVWFNLEAEIIEEKPKKIELLEIEYENKTTNNCYIKNENGTKCFLTKHSKMIAEKLNELTKTVNCLLEKSDKDEC